MPSPSPIIMKSPIINWKCLADSTPDPKPTQNQRKTNSRNPKPKPKPSSTSASVPKTTIVSSHPETTTIDQNTTKTHVTNLCNIPSSQLPQLVIKGDRLSIVILEDDYNEGMTACKFNLHARILWVKGSTPLTVHALKTKLSIMWKDMS
ncbi:hypothetical protein MTR_2g043180 [Medicago truncatula]|uniref:DUF4283 domain protein n=1 Tax=Medicago truncatula TaxID=3880 RepID=A0A072VHH6_MEDTR|nr:hypothetical protein MTR_2g043180 [Medicago truncatula]